MTTGGPADKLKILYDEVCQCYLNIDSLIPFSSWTRTQKDLAKKIGLSNRNPESLFAVGYDRLKYNDCVPSAIIKYDIILTIAKNKNNMRVSDLHEEYFSYPPNDITTVKTCHGNCLYSKLVENGIWCDKCFGLFNFKNIVRYLMRESINFDEIPFSSVVYIKKNVTPIGEQNFNMLVSAIDLVKHEETRLTDLQNRIDGLSDRIRDFVEEELTLDANDKEVLQAALAESGSDIDNYHNQVIYLENKIKQLVFRKEQKVLLQKKNKIEKELTDLNKKMNQY